MYMQEVHEMKEKPNNWLNTSKKGQHQTNIDLNKSIKWKQYCQSGFSGLIADVLCNFMYLAILIIMIMKWGMYEVKAKYQI